MRTVISTDGTSIAYDAWGDGPAVVVVGGAMNDRAVWVELARALAAAGLMGVTYDRRGRGGSGDTRPYAVQREIEDLAAVVDAVGEPCGVHAVSSGGALAFRAIAAGVPVRRLSVLEVPYRVDGAPQPPADYTDHLRRLYDEDRRGEMVEWFETRAVGIPQQVVDQQKGRPAWDWMCALAPTLLYDGLCLGGNRQGLPLELLGSVRVPVLSIDSTGSADFLRAAARAAAEALPEGRHVSLEGGFHDVPLETLVPAIVSFHAPG